jgi:hypothetical protein
MKAQDADDESIVLVFYSEDKGSEIEPDQIRRGTRSQTFNHCDMHICLVG